MAAGINSHLVQTGSLSSVARMHIVVSTGSNAIQLFLVRSGHQAVGRLRSIVISRIGRRAPSAVALQELVLIRHLRARNQTIAAIGAGSCALKGAVSSIFLIDPLGRTICTPAQDLPGSTARRHMLIASTRGMHIVISARCNAVQFGLIAGTHQTGSTGCRITIGGVRGGCPSTVAAQILTLFAFIRCRN